MRDTPVDVLIRAIPEKEWAQTVVQYARLNRWLVYFTWRSTHSPSGFPDLVLVRPPRLIVAELKKETGKPTAAQTAWLAALDAVPSIQTAIWRPSDWPTVRDTLL